MRLPAPERALVDPRKVRDYLLSPEHPVGRFKARAFAAAGYRQADWVRLQQDLQRVAQSADAVSTGTTAYGQSFELPAILQSPTGTPLPVVTVWIVRAGEDFPRLVTAYPGVLR